MQRKQTISLLISMSTKVIFENILRKCHIINVLHINIKILIVSQPRWPCKQYTLQKYFMCGIKKSHTRARCFFLLLISLCCAVICTILYVPIQ